MKSIEKGTERKYEFELEPKSELKKEKAEKIFGWFNSGLLHEKDLKNFGLDSHSLESEIKDLIKRQVRETLKQTDLEMIAEIKDFAGRQKTAVYSCPGLDYVVKVVDDISPYRLAERVNINGVGTAFTILKNLECNIKGEPIILPEVVIEIKTTPLEQKLNSLLKKGDLPQAKLLMEKFIETVETGWKRGFQFGMDHFLKDYGEGTAFTILKNLECNIKGESIILPEVVIEIKTTPLEQKLNSLLKKGDLPQAKLLMEKFMETVETGWKRGFQFGMDHFLKDYGEDPSGKVTCFDPVIELQKPDVRRDKESIRRSLLALQGLSSEFVDFAVNLIEKKFKPEILDKIWKTEEGGRNVFIPNEESRKKILQFLETRLENEK